MKVTALKALIYYAMCSCLACSFQIGIICLPALGIIDLGTIYCNPSLIRFIFHLFFTLIKKAVGK